MSRENSLVRRINERNKTESLSRNVTINQGKKKRFEVHNHKVVSQDEWLAKRKQLLIKEKEFTRSTPMVT